MIQCKDILIIIDRTYVISSEDTNYYWYMIHVKTLFDYLAYYMQFEINLEQHTVMGLLI